MLEIGTYRAIVTGELLYLSGRAMTCRRYAKFHCCGDIGVLMLKQIVCVGSVAELEELSGVKGITDLHRDKIDHITIPSKKGKGVLRRIEEIFDCWFESGRYRAVFS